MDADHICRLISSFTLCTLVWITKLHIPCKLNNPCVSAAFVFAGTGTICKQEKDKNNRTDRVHNCLMRLHYHRIRRLTNQRKKSAWWYPCPGCCRSHIPVFFCRRKCPERHLCRYIFYFKLFFQCDYPSYLYCIPKWFSQGIYCSYMAGIYWTGCNFNDRRTVHLQSSFKKSTCFCSNNEHSGGTDRHLFPCLSDTSWSSCTPTIYRNIGDHVRNDCVFLFSGP